LKQIHLIMPFSRHENKETLTEAYRPMGIIWHPIVFEDEEKPFGEDWILPFIIPMHSSDCKVKMPGTYKRNRWIEKNQIIDEDYYVTVDDDDMYEPGVFDAVKQMDDDIVIISMKRGNNCPDGVSLERRYPTDTLIANPGNVRIGEISAQQSFVKGKIFKQHFFNEGYHCWDGEIAIHHKEGGEQIAYRPDLFALFNYYEPGRWAPKKISISFGCMVNDICRLDMCLRQSEIDPFNFTINTIKAPTSATKGLNKLLGIIEDEGTEIAALVHQDMFFRQGWMDQVREQIATLHDSWIVAGVIGKDLEGNIRGEFHDMRIPLQFHQEGGYPFEACCFDECCIFVNMKTGFRFDESLEGFDLYGTLAVLQAWEMGGTAWIIDGFCEHYCMRPFTWIPEDIFGKRFMWLHERFPDAPRIDTTVLGVLRGSPPRHDEILGALSMQIATQEKALKLERWVA
jgi:hypothetical protein